MYTTVISVQSVFSGCFHIVVDDFEVYFGEVTYLYRLVQEFFQAALFCQSLIDLFPCTVLVRIHFTFSVLGTATLSVDKTLRAVNDRTDTTGNVQIALCTCVTALFGKCHTVMTSVVERITCRNHRFSSQIRNRLDTKTTGDHNYVLCSFRKQIL